MKTLTLDQVNVETVKDTICNWCGDTKPACVRSFKHPDTLIPEYKTEFNKNGQRVVVSDNIAWVKVPAAICHECIKQLAKLV